jgi:hypothetical protein
MLVVDKRCLIIEYIHSLSLEEVPPGCDPRTPVSVAVATSPSITPHAMIHVLSVSDETRSLYEKGGLKRRYLESHQP